ncbi:GNAT family N-acetyltransferase [Altererythrobacter aerius]|uniref:GNAT family N-acetyltransferase n=2 Tax=Tsuneonella aeria TaxID=1837929 RepID=A0A6I4TAB8_9SPHN|nr:GNAT family N-acetyltransferase [Tsuneonella aeria]
MLEDSGHKPLIALAGDANGRDQALVLEGAAGRLQSLANWYAFTWRPIGNDPSLMEAIARSLRQSAYRVTLRPVPEENGVAAILCRAFRKSGWHVRCVRSDVNHVLRVGGRTFAQYWGGRPGALRTAVSRKGGRVDVQVFRHFDADSWKSFEAVYADSWKPAEGDPEFLRRFARAEGDAGRIRLAIATKDGQPVAAQFWTVENATAYIHKLAHRESASYLSPGTIVTARLMAEVIDRDNVEFVDFGTGDDAYKADWMEIVRPRFTIDCLNPSNPRAWPALAKRMLAPVRAAV